MDAPEVWTRVAREENQGNVELIDKALRAAAPEAQKADYGRAAEKALAAVRDFDAFLAGTLSKKISDWRLGKEKYARKFEYVLLHRFRHRVALLDALQAGRQHAGEGEVGVAGGVRRPVLDSRAGLLAALVFRYADQV